MIDIFILIVIFVLVVIGATEIQENPEHKGIFASLMLIFLSTVGLFRNKMFFKIGISDGKAVKVINWLFLILGIILAILCLTIWRENI